MRGIRSFFAGLVFFLISSLPVYPQTAQSPYTALGLGDIIQPQLVPNMGMGVASVAYPSYKNFNLLNPAMLGIRTYLTTFEAGFSGETRLINRDTLSQRNGSGNLNYLALAFPIWQSKISAGIGLTPYSYMNYNIISENDVNGREEIARFNFRGNGGMNSVFWSTGMKIFRKFAVGMKVSYLFGARVEETIIDVAQANAYTTALYEETKVNDFHLALGLAYDHRFNENSEIILAGIYELGNDLNATRQERLERRQPSTGLLLSTDTILSDVKGTIRLPQKYGVGISYIHANKWLLSGDLLMQDWSGFTNFRNQEDLLSNSYRAAFGVEYIPDPSSVSNYLERMVYRVGGYYETTPFRLNNEQIYDFGINFGVSLPVLNLNSPSLVSFALQYGQRSGNIETPITENYFRVALGFTINDIWFYRRKID